MIKEFIKRIQSLEEGKRRQLLTALTVVSGILIVLFWITQFQAIIENQNQAPAKISQDDGLPSIQDNLKSQAQELWGMLSNFNSYLQSQVNIQNQQITPAPSTDGSLPPAVKLNP